MMQIFREFLQNGIFYNRMHCSILTEWMQGLLIVLQMFLYIIYCRSLPYTFEGEDQILVIFLGMLIGITSKIFSAICQ